MNRMLLQTFRESSDYQIPDINTDQSSQFWKKNVLLSLQGQIKQCHSKMPKNRSLLKIMTAKYSFTKNLPQFPEMWTCDQDIRNGILTKMSDKWIPMNIISLIYIKLIDLRPTWQMRQSHTCMRFEVLMEVKMSMVALFLCIHLRVHMASRLRRPLSIIIYLHLLLHCHSIMFLQFKMLG
jgi:hypothetical protein